jgi:pimeloyl-ACP methyl ester carboxylesterase
MRVAVGELRGHGLSDRPRRWTLEHHLELDLPALAGAAADLGGGAPHLIAHSMGGMLGYASLAHGLGWRSLTTIAAPVALGRGSPLVGLAARASRPAAWLARHRPVPMDWFLARLAALLSRHPAPLGWRAVQRVLALTNPAEANPEVLREVLEESDPESMDVFRAFLEQALGGRGRLCGVDLVRAVRDAAVPVAVITGGRDIFAPPASVGPLEGAGHAGPRRFVVLRRASHVDLTVGRRVARTLQALVGFLEGS